MRRSIDDYPFNPADYPDHYEEDELTPISWGVAISDDYDDADPRVVLTVEEVGRAGYGLVGHLNAEVARRLRGAIRDALVEIGQDPRALSSISQPNLCRELGQPAEPVP